MTVRRAVEEDLDAALSLVNGEGWMFDRDDLEAMLEMEPDGLFCVEEEGDLVGLTTTASYDRIGWIGNVVVRPDRRGHGLGTEVVRAARDHLLEQGADAVGLYALPGSRSLYARLGFEPRFDVAAFEGRRSDGAGDGSVDVGTVEKIDRRHVHVDRSRYLRHLLGRDGVRAAARDGAYAIARPGRVWEVGPAVADPDDDDAAREVLETVLAGVEGRLEAAVPEPNEAGRAFWREQGLERAYTSTLMLTEDVPLYDPEAVWGVLGLEKG